jgi:hypothetical protein
MMTIQINKHIKLESGYTLTFFLPEKNSAQYQNISCHKHIYMLKGRDDGLEGGE